MSNDMSNGQDNGQNCTCYIGNLNYATSKEGVIEFLLPHVAKRVTLVTDRDTGRSKGYAFAEFATADEANKAVEDLDGIEFDSRCIVVSMALPRKPRQERR